LIKRIGETKEKENTTRIVKADKKYPPTKVGLKIIKLDSNS
jgi:hypothetical protein